MYVPTNPNPHALVVGDCVYRAISIATDKSWDYTYWMLAIQGFIDTNAPIANEVWENYLRSIGFKRFFIPDSCPHCYTVRDFCHDNPYGTFVLATGTHVIAIIDGDYYDAWDSGDEVPSSVWRKEEYE